MGRAGYDDCGGMDSDERWQWICWRGAVKSAIRGRKGQAFLKEMLAALEALPDAHLIIDEMEDIYGSVCALGAVGQVRKIDLSRIDPYDYSSVAGAFGIPESLAREIMHLNDDYNYQSSPRERWYEMKVWLERQIK